MFVSKLSCLDLLRLALHADLKMMPPVKKPKFEERNINCFVYKSGVHDFEYVHSAKAIDVATGIEAKGQNYKSKSGAKKHAHANLKEELLKRGIIS